MGKSYKERPDKYKYQNSKKKSKNKQKGNRPLNKLDDTKDSYE